jgi:cell division protein ZapA
MEYGHKGAPVKRTMEISIMGQKFMIKSESDDEYVGKVAKFVDTKIGEVMQSTKSVASLNVAILAAMNIADEYFKFRRDRQDRFTKVEKKIEDLIELIDLQI